jgi:hypothetical protein
VARVAQASEQSGLSIEEFPARLEQTGWSETPRIAAILAVCAELAGGGGS